MSTTFHQADARNLPLDDRSVHCAVTSPPYFGLRDYDTEGQIGLEQTPQEYVEQLVQVFREVRRMLRDDGTLWLNLGDSYAGSGRGGNPAGPTSTLQGGQESQLASMVVGQTARDAATTRGPGDDLRYGYLPKNLMGMPWRVAMALQADGWYLRADIIWHKPNPMPSSVKDRPTTAHEYVFLLAKAERYFYDALAVAEPAARSKSGNKARRTGEDYGRPGHHVGASVPWQGTTRNRRSVWTISTEACKEAHFATFPTKLVTPCILAGTSERGCCPACAAPWKRMVDKVRRPTRPGADTKVTGDAMTDGSRDPQRHVTEAVTTGWVPTCTCSAGQPVPCTVLDPFSGAGTTVMVADRLGRNGVGVELSADYIAIAERRLSRDREKRRAVRPMQKTTVAGREAA